MVSTDAAPSDLHLGTSALAAASSVKCTAAALARQTSIAPRGTSALPCFAPPCLVARPVLTRPVTATAAAGSHSTDGAHGRKRGRNGSRRKPAHAKVQRKSSRRGRPGPSSELQAWATLPTLPSVGTPNQFLPELAAKPRKSTPLRRLKPRGLFAAEQLPAATLDKLRTGSYIKGKAAASESDLESQASGSGDSTYERFCYSVLGEGRQTDESSSDSSFVPVAETGDAKAPVSPVYAPYSPLRLPPSPATAAAFGTSVAFEFPVSDGDSDIGSVSTVELDLSDNEAPPSGPVDPRDTPLQAAANAAVRAFVALNMQSIVAMVSLVAPNVSLTLPVGVAVASLATGNPIHHSRVMLTIPSRDAEAAPVVICFGARTGLTIFNGVHTNFVASFGNQFFVPLAPQSTTGLAGGQVKFTLRTTADAALLKHLGSPTVSCVHQIGSRL